MFENIGTSVIGCHDGLVDIEPESQSQWLDSKFDIERGVKIGVARVAAVSAFEETLVSHANLTASSAGLARVGRTDIYNRTSSHQRFIFDEALKLSESPRMERPVEPSAFIGTDSSQVLHRNDVAFLQSVYDFPAYPMVLAPHKTCPSTGQSFKMPFGGFRSFALERGDEPLMFDHLRDNATIEFVIGCDGKVLYSDIDAKNAPMLSRAYVGRDVFGKTYTEKNTILPVNPDEAFIDVPIGIFESIMGKRNIKLLPTCNRAETQYSTLVGEASWRIEPHRTVGNCRLALGYLDHPTRLFDASYGQLSGQSFSQMVIDERVEPNVVSDTLFTRDVDAVLKSSPVDTHSFEYFPVVWESEVHRNSTQHTTGIEGKGINTPQFLPRISVGILEGTKMNANGLALQKLNFARLAVIFQHHRSNISSCL